MSNQIKLQTERTILRNLTIDDAKDFYELNLDDDVLKFTGDKPFDSIETAKNFLMNYDQYEKYGVGRFAVIDKQNLNFIGWCGLKYNSEMDEYDVGFRFFKQYWNKGFATETAQRCLAFGFQELKINRIVGRAMKDNTASVKVLEKIGMTFVKNIDFDTQVGVLYEMSK